MLKQRLDNLFLLRRRLIDFGWRIALTFSTLELKKKIKVTVFIIKWVTRGSKGLPTVQHEKQTAERCNRECSVMRYFDKYKKCFLLNSTYMIPTKLLKEVIIQKWIA